MPDGGMDAFVEDPDAFVPIGLDAPFPDAWEPDAFAPPDAWAPDAFVPIGIDAPFPDAFTPPPDAYVLPDAYRAPDAHVVPDAHVPPDAFVAPDAFTPAARENCLRFGDEDGNALADCADPACSSLAVCNVAGCAPAGGVPAVPTVSFSPPIHWYRADRGLITGSGQVCGWLDLVGREDFLGTLGSSPAPGTLGGQPALDFVADSEVATRDIGIACNGGYTVVLVSQRISAGGMASTVLTAFAPDSLTYFLQMTQNGAAPAGYGLRVQDGRYSVGTEATMSPTFEVIMAPGLRGVPISTSVTYRRNGFVIPLSLTAGPDTGGTCSFVGLPRTSLGHALTSFRVAEVMVFAGTPSASDLTLIEAYLGIRYGIPLP